MPAPRRCLPEGDGFAVRPALRHARCLNGHDLDLAGRSRGWDTIRRLATGCCALCRQLGWPRATWVEVDLRFADETPMPAPSVILAAEPPTVPGGVEQIMLRMEGTTVADLDVQVCQTDRIGVIEQVRVDDRYLRQGFGTVLVTAALARGRDYRWSTTAITDTAAAEAFWAAQQLPDGMTLGDPERCTHMLEASEFA
ncbi:hypothetical protein DL991_10515 [Amycolatopsis sp. WAC 01375]|uniref:GNAT family N-acetyltransferase n=1 Tax=Amycolatopsis sp. WAC 01375 TaxID=2203194 RepID=UPI000F7B5BF1|nr:GNAT family N-acetyltransferase [Amycolatopsis sp. WAC 01375]RSM80541.1 hypothetical protein DL991_10515 [Amycolatopsis sp. WAC 01375]